MDNILQSPFNEINKPIKLPKPDGLVETKMVLSIKHFPTEDFLLREAMHELNMECREAIERVFKKYMIEKPSNDLAEL